MLLVLVLCRSRGIWGICRSPASHCLLALLSFELLFEQSVMCGELALQSGLSCNSIHSAMSDGAAQPGCQKERCDARLKGKYFRDSNSRPQHVLLARKHCLYSGFDNFNAIVIVIISSPRAKCAGPKGLHAESARAFTGRRNSHSGRGEDF